MMTPKREKLKYGRRISSDTLHSPPFVYPVYVDSC